MEGTPGRYTVLVGGGPDQLLVAGVVEKSGETVKVPAWQRGSWYEKPSAAPSLEEWERMLGRKYEPHLPRKGQFTMNDTVMDMKEHSPVMRGLYWGLRRMAARKAKPGTAEYRMILQSTADSPLRILEIFSGLGANLFRGLLAMANGKYFSGLKLLLMRSGSR